METSPHALPTAPDKRTILSVRLPFGLTATSLALLGIVVLAALLRFSNMDVIGQSNTYYTAAVASMLQSWHNFFFVAAEPGGSVSIDKPPVGLWLQTISAYFLGVNGFAVVLPQILAGIGSVILLFHLVRRSFGNGAGLIAALVMAVTPVAVAVERNNTPDATLIFTLLLAAWAFILATERRKLRWLVVGAVLVGIGFNIKMMQALLPLPAMYALYFFGAQGRWWRKIVHLGVATLVLIPVALSWAIAVDLTPADQRPYVGSSQNNSALNLIIGYNGVQRLTGMGGGGGATRTPSNQAVTMTPPNTDGRAQPANGTAPVTPPTMGGNRADGGADNGGMFGTGAAGPLRLFQSGLAAQVSWLLPFGLLTLIPMAIGMSWRKPHTDLQRGLLLWGGWLLTCAVFFSVAGFFHQYYLAMLAPPLAALVAMGVGFLWHQYATHPLRAAAWLIAAAGATLAFQVYAVAMYGVLNGWIAVPIVVGGAGIGLLLLTVRRERPVLTRTAWTLLVGALLAVPTAWSGLTIASVNSTLPTAYIGTMRVGMGGRPNNALPPTNVQSTERPDDGAMDGFGQGGVNQALLAYLEANTQDTTYLVVVPSAQAGAGYVLATGRSVLYAGGFSGGDPVIDADDLAELVANRAVRYVLWGGGGRNGGAKSSITTYLQTYGTVVSDASLGTTTSATTQRMNGRGGPGGEQLTLYQLGD